jgi:hypothetical protein
MAAEKSSTELSMSSTHTGVPRPEVSIRLAEFWTLKTLGRELKGFYDWN